MKKLFSILLIGLLATACGNNTTDSTTTTTAAPGAPGTDNVHGNIPDTSRAIKPGNPLPIDSSKVDSVPR